MDKAKAIGMLKQYREEIPDLQRLRYGCREFQLWRDRVDQVIRTALSQEDFTTFTTINSASMPISYVEPDRDRDLQDYYVRSLAEYGVNIEKIIQKYEILGVEEALPRAAGLPVKGFISHGKKSEALARLKDFLLALGVQPIVAEEHASLDKTVDDKVNHCLGQADFVIVLATGDDEFEGKLHLRGNVTHEIGLAQKTHADKIIYLLEEGAEFPSNIGAKVYQRFTKTNMQDAFLCVARELHAYGWLRVSRV